MDNPRMAMDRLSLLYETVGKDKRKREIVIWCVVNIYSQMKDYIETLKWLNELLTMDAENQRVHRNLSKRKKSDDVIVGMVRCLLYYVDAWGYRACKGNKEETDESRSVQYDCRTLFLFRGRLQWLAIVFRCVVKQTINASLQGPLATLTRSRVIRTSMQWLRITRASVNCSGATTKQQSILCKAILTLSRSSTYR